MPTPPFCCHHQDLQPIGPSHSASHLELWHFTWCVSDDVSPQPSPPTPSSAPQKPPTPPKFLDPFIQSARFAIQVEKWINGQQPASSRFFIPHHGLKGVYFGVERDWVWDRFVWSCEYIKLVCEHEDVFYVVKMLARNENSASSTNQRMRVSESSFSVDMDEDMEVEDGEDGEEIDWEEVVLENRRKRFRKWTWVGMDGGKRQHVR